MTSSEIYFVEDRLEFMVIKIRKMDNSDVFRRFVFCVEIYKVKMRTSIKILKVMVESLCFYIDKLNGIFEFILFTNDLS